MKTMKRLVVGLLVACAACGSRTEAPGPEGVRGQSAGTRPPAAARDQIAHASGPSSMTANVTEKLTSGTKNHPNVAMTVTGCPGTATLAQELTADDNHEKSGSTSDDWSIPSDITVGRKTCYASARERENTHNLVSFELQETVRGAVVALIQGRVCWAQCVPLSCAAHPCTAPCSTPLPMLPLPVGGGEQVAAAFQLITNECVGRDGSPAEGTLTWAAVEPVDALPPCLEGETGEHAYVLFEDASALVPTCQGRVADGDGEWVQLPRAATLPVTTRPHWIVVSDGCRLHRVQESPAGELLRFHRAPESEPTGCSDSRPSD